MKFRYKNIVALLFLATVSCGGAMAQTMQSFYFLDGVEALLLGNAEKGEKELLMVTEINPTHAPSYYYLSKIELGRNNTAKALEYIEKATKIDTTSINYADFQLQLLLASGDLEKALIVAEKLLEKNPHDEDYYILTASILSEKQEVGKAIEICENYEKLFGINSMIVEIAYNTYIRNKDYYSALGYIQRISDLAPTEIRYLLTLADLTAAFNNNNEAEKLYYKALEIEPTSIEAQLSLVNFYKITNNMPQYIVALRPAFENNDMRLDKKIELFEEYFFKPDLYYANYNQIRSLISSLLITYPTDIDVRLLYGRYLTYMGDVDATRTHYETMYNEGSNSVNKTLFERLCDLYIYDKNYPRAIQVATEGYRMFGGFSFLRGEIVGEWLSGNTSVAQKRIKEALKLTKSDSLKSELYGLSGDIYNELKQMSKCFAAYKKALKYNPDNALVLNNYAYYLALDNKDLDKAKVMAKRANELSPDNATYLDTEAWVLFVSGDLVEAQLLMTRVMELDANPSGDILMHYGDILYAMGDDLLARNYWKKALEAGADVAEIEKRVLQKKAVRPVINE